MKIVALATMCLTSVSLLATGFGCSGDDTGGQGGSTTATGTGGSGGEPQCIDDSDCPDWDNPCWNVWCEHGVCVGDYSVTPGHCWIDDVCYSEDDEHPTNPCKYCKPPDEVCGDFEWSNKEEETPCGQDLVCRSGQCVPA